MTRAEHMSNDRSELNARMQDHIKFSALVSKRQLAEELFCYMHKWFEYRFMSPEDATRCFVNEYQVAYRRHWRETQSIEDADKKLGIRGDNWMSNSRELTSFWSARQHADMLGVPYPFFIMRALEAAERRGARQPPRPNQLFKVANLVHVQEQWERYIDDGALRLPNEPVYREENFRGLHGQIAYRDWIVERIKARHARPDVIGRCVVSERVLPADRAAHEFGEDRLVDACRDAEGSEVAQVEKVGKLKMLPACFALPQALALTSEPCHSCPAQTACRKSATMVRDRVIADYGTVDPVGTKKLESNAARQRSFRSRKRAANTITPRVSVG